MGSGVCAPRAGGNDGHSSTPPNSSTERTARSNAAHAMTLNRGLSPSRHAFTLHAPRWRPGSLGVDMTVAPPKLMRVYDAQQLTMTALRTIAPSLLFGSRLWASVCLALYVYSGLSVRMRLGRLH